LLSKHLSLALIKSSPCKHQPTWDLLLKFWLTGDLPMMVTQVKLGALTQNWLFNFDSINRLTTTLYDKRDGFDFAIVNFSSLRSNIPHSLAYGVYISQLIRYARACFAYEDFKTRKTTYKQVDVAGL
jgi:hypothetical protein